MAFRFENLVVWNSAVEFAGKIYKLSFKFPPNEIYGLTGQIRRAANSISLNIAEGSGRKSKEDFKRFIDFSLGSLFEVVTCFYLARNNKYITEEIFNDYRDQAEKLAKQITSFKNSLK